MKKKILIITLGFLLVGVNIFAAGDLIVNGKLGVGTSSSELSAEQYYKLNVKDDNKFVNIGTALNAAGMMISETTDLMTANGFLGYDYGSQLFQVSSNNGIKFVTNWPSNSQLALYVDTNGNVGIGTSSPAGSLDVNGAIYQRGSQLHADYVFEPDYNLESIEEHAEFMWKNKHLKAIPKTVVDENGQEVIDVGAHRRGIVEELEKAHIYIEQLHKQIKVLEERLSKLEAQNKYSN